MPISSSRAFFAGAAGAFLVLAASLVILPQYSDYTGRAAAYDVLLLARPIQDQVEARALELNSMVGAGAEIAVLPTENRRVGIAEGFVLASGEIILRAKPFGQVFVLVPFLERNQVVTWRCIAGSAKDVPTKCR